MSQEAEEQFDPGCFISWRKALIAEFFSKREEHDIGNLCQLHKTCSGTASVCLNIRHYNTHLFGNYRQGTEFARKIKHSPRTSKNFY